jgi:hypothetical protein
MIKVTIDAETEADAIAKCKEICKWTPDAIREVDSGDDDTRTWMCFQDAQDALLWDNQS